MAVKLNVRKVALSVGFTVTAMHTIGVILLLNGFVNYFQWVHFFASSYTVMEFSAVPFIAGILTAFVVGCFVGWLFSTIYNALK